LWWKKTWVDPQPYSWRRPKKKCVPKPQRSGPSTWELGVVRGSKAAFLDHPCVRTDHWHTQVRAAIQSQATTYHLVGGKPVVAAKLPVLDTKPPNHLPYMKRYGLRLEHKRTVAEWDKWVEEAMQRAGHQHFAKIMVPAWEALRDVLKHAEDDLDSEFWDWASNRCRWLNPQGCPDVEEVEKVEYSEC
jgi:hypothetical protein